MLYHGKLQQHLRLEQPQHTRTYLRPGDVGLHADVIPVLYCRTDVERNDIVSMMVIRVGVVIVIIDHVGRRLGLPNAPVVIEHDNNRTEL